MGNAKIKDIAEIMDMIAPEETAAGFDNVGLLVGDPEIEVTGITLAIDVDEDVISFAEANGCNLIITHHPLIFSPLKRVTTGDAVGSLVYRLISKGISLYSAHTNFDKASGGTDDVLSEVIGMENARLLDAEEGFGRVGELNGVTAGELRTKLNKILGSNAVMTADENKVINTVASTAGAGGSCIQKAIEHKADIFVTGEVNYHAALDAKRMGLDIMLLSHRLSEEYSIKFLKNTLQNHLNGVQYNVRVILAPFNRFWL